MCVLCCGLVREDREQFPQMRVLPDAPKVSPAAMRDAQFELAAGQMRNLLLLVGGTCSHQELLRGVSSRGYSPQMERDSAAEVFLLDPQGHMQNGKILPRRTVCSDLRVGITKMLSTFNAARTLGEGDAQVRFLSFKGILTPDFVAEGVAGALFSTAQRAALLVVPPRFLMSRTYPEDVVCRSLREVPISERFAI